MLDKFIVKWRSIILKDANEKEFYDLMQTAWKNLQTAIELKRKKLNIKSLSHTTVTQKANAQKNFLYNIKEDTFDETRLSSIYSMFKICKYLDVDFKRIFYSDCFNNSEKDITIDIQNLKYEGEYYVYLVVHYSLLEKIDKILEGKLEIYEYNKCKLSFDDMEGFYFEGELRKNKSNDVITINLFNKIDCDNFFINLLHHQESTDEYIGGLAFVQRLTVYPSKEIPLFQMMILSKVKLDNHSLIQGLLEIKSTDSNFQLALLKKNEHLLYSYIKKIMQDKNMKIKNYIHENGEVIIQSKKVQLSDYDVETLKLIHSTNYLK